MAIYHLSMKIFRRHKGQNSVACAAYRSGWPLKDTKSDLVKHYTNRNERIIFRAVFAPDAAPAWLRDRETLWNAVERIETRFNSRLAREFEIALPHELSDVERLYLVQDFVREQFVRKHLIADVAIHAPDRDADPRNYHFHIMVPERRVTAAGFSATKDRSLEEEEFLKNLRRHWQDLCNRHLERYAHAARIDHRSLANQGIQRRPGIHLGYVASDMERKGKLSERGDRQRRIQKHNAERRQSSLALAMAHSAAALEDARHLQAALEAGVEPEDPDFETVTDIWNKPVGPR